LFGALTNGKPVSEAISAAGACAKPCAEVMPVPTAVPPSAKAVHTFQGILNPFQIVPERAGIA